jgi:hypothetical protein
MSATNLEQWLQVATRNLPRDVALTVRGEVEAHYEEAMAEYEARGLGREAAQAAALADLGEARKVGHALRRVYLSPLQRLWISLVTTPTLRILAYAQSGGTFMDSQREAQALSLLTPLIVLVTAPFWLTTAIAALLKLLVVVFAGQPPAGVALLFVPLFFVAMLLGDATRFGILGLTALLLTLAGLIWLVLRRRRQAENRHRLYLLAGVLVLLLSSPLIIRYRPAVQAEPSVEMRIVERPGLLKGMVKSYQNIAEIRGCQYEPLGWMDEGTLLYRTWCGGGYNAEGEWEPGSPGETRFYDVENESSGTYLSDEEILREPCNPRECVRPHLAYTPSGYYPGVYPEALVSPDGRWVAFTAEHIFGPEDLLVIARE